MAYWFKVAGVLIVLGCALITHPALAQTSADTVVLNGNQLPYIRSGSYPIKAEEAEIEGVVMIEFTVDTLCRISKKRVLTGIGYGCDEVALQTINRRFEELFMKRNHFQCHPGQMTVPVIFKLSE